MSENTSSLPAIVLDLVLNVGDFEDKIRQVISSVRKAQDEAAHTDVGSIQLDRLTDGFNQLEHAALKFNTVIEKLSNTLNTAFDKAVLQHFGQLVSQVHGSIDGGVEAFGVNKFGAQLQAAQAKEQDAIKQKIALEVQYNELLAKQKDIQDRLSGKVQTIGPAQDKLKEAEELNTEYRKLSVELQNIERQYAKFDADEKQAVRDAENVKKSYQDLTGKPLFDSGARNSLPVKEANSYRDRVRNADNTRQEVDKLTGAPIRSFLDRQTGANLDVALDGWLRKLSALKSVGTDSFGAIKIAVGETQEKFNNAAIAFAKVERAIELFKDAQGATRVAIKDRSISPDEGDAKIKEAEGDINTLYGVLTRLKTIMDDAKTEARALGLELKEVTRTDKAGAIVTSFDTFDNKINEVKNDAADLEKLLGKQVLAKDQVSPDIQNKRIDATEINNLQKVRDLLSEQQVIQGRIKSESTAIAASITLEKAAVDRKIQSLEQERNTQVKNKATAEIAVGGTTDKGELTRLENEAHQADLQIQQLTKDLQLLKQYKSGLGSAEDNAVLKAQTQLTQSNISGLQAQRKHLEDNAKGWALTRGQMLEVIGASRLMDGQVGQLVRGLGLMGAGLQTTAARITAVVGIAVAIAERLVQASINALHEVLELKNLAEGTGATIVQIKALNNALEEGGHKSEVIIGGIRKLNEAFSSTTPAAIDLKNQLKSTFDVIGVAIPDNAKVFDTLKLFIQHFAELQRLGLADKLAFDIFGKSAVELQGDFTDLNTRIDKHLESLKKDKSLTQEAVDSAIKYEASITKLKDAFRDFLFGLHIPDAVASFFASLASIANGNVAGKLDAIVGALLPDIQVLGVILADAPPSVGATPTANEKQNQARQNVIDEHEDVVAQKKQTPDISSTSGAENVSEAGLLSKYNIKSRLTQSQLDEISNIQADEVSLRAKQEIEKKSLKDAEDIKSQINRKTASQEQINAAENNYHKKLSELAITEQAIDLLQERISQIKQKQTTHHGRTQEQRDAASRFQEEFSDLKTAYDEDIERAKEAHDNLIIKLKDDAKHGTAQVTEVSQAEINKTLELLSLNEQKAAALKADVNKRIAELRATQKSDPGAEQEIAKLTKQKNAVDETAFKQRTALSREISKAEVAVRDEILKIQKEYQELELSDLKAFNKRKIDAINEFTGDSIALKQYEVDTQFKLQQDEIAKELAIAQNQYKQQESLIAQSVLDKTGKFKGFAISGRVSDLFGVDPKEINDVIAQLKTAKDLGSEAAINLLKTVLGTQEKLQDLIQAKAFANLKLQLEEVQKLIDLREKEAQLQISSLDIEKQKIQFQKDKGLFGELSITQKLNDLETDKLKIYYQQLDIIKQREQVIRTQTALNIDQVTKQATAAGESPAKVEALRQKALSESNTSLISLQSEADKLKEIMYELSINVAQANDRFFIFAKGLGSLADRIASIPGSTQLRSFIPQEGYTQLANIFRGLQAIVERQTARRLEGEAQALRAKQADKAKQDSALQIKVAESITKIPDSLHVATTEITKAILDDIGTKFDKFGDAALTFQADVLYSGNNWVDAVQQSIDKYFIPGFKTAREILDTGHTAGTSTAGQAPLTSQEFASKYAKYLPRLTSSKLDIVSNAAISQGVDPNLLLTILSLEGSLKGRAVSHMGAKGPFQFTDATAATFGLKDPYDLEQSAVAAAKYVKKLLDLFNGNVGLTLAGYNAGPGHARSFINSVKETRDYARTGTERYQGIGRYSSVDELTNRQLKSAADFFGDSEEQAKSVKEHSKKIEKSFDEVADIAKDIAAVIKLSATYIEESNVSTPISNLSPITPNFPSPPSKTSYSGSLGSTSIFSINPLENVLTPLLDNVLSVNSPHGAPSESLVKKVGGWFANIFTNPKQDAEIKRQLNNGHVGERIFEGVTGAIGGVLQGLSSASAGGKVGGFGSAVGSIVGIFSSAGPVIGQIAGIAGGIMDFIGGIWKARAQKVADGIQADFKTIMDKFKNGTATLGETITSLQTELGKARSQLGSGKISKKGGKIALQGIEQQIGDQIQELRNQAKQLQQTFKQNLQDLRLDPSLRGTAKSISDAFDQVRKYLQSFETPAEALNHITQANEFLNRTLTELRNDASKQLDDLIKQEQDAERAYQQQVLSIINQGRVQTGFEAAQDKLAQLFELEAKRYQDKADAQKNEDLLQQKISLLDSAFTKAGNVIDNMRDTFSGVTAALNDFTNTFKGGINLGSGGGSQNINININATGGSNAQTIVDALEDRFRKMGLANQTASYYNPSRPYSP